MGRYQQAYLVVPSKVVGGAPEVVEVSYLTDYSAVINKPPISYDSSLDITKVASALQTKGDITTAGRVYNAVWNDYAELFLKGEDVEPGDILTYNPEDNKCYKSTNICDPLVVGVVSDCYGHLLGGDKDVSLEDNLIKYAPVGLAGRLYVKVMGEVNPGDPIVASNTPGVGVSIKNWDKYNTCSFKVLGSVLGKALTSVKDGKVLMLISTR